MPSLPGVVRRHPHPVLRIPEPPPQQHSVSSPSTPYMDSLSRERGLGMRASKCQGPQVHEVRSHRNTSSQFLAPSSLLYRVMNISLSGLLTFGGFHEKMLVPGLTLGARVKTTVFGGMRDMRCEIGKEALMFKLLAHAGMEPTRLIVPSPRRTAQRNRDAAASRGMTEAPPWVGNRSGVFCI